MAAKRKAAAPAGAEAGGTGGNGMAALVKELWQAAVTLRGSIEPADYKRYVLPIIFLRFLSLRYERRRDELAALISDKKSDYFGDKKALSDPDEYRSAGAFLVPEKARWENIVAEAQSDEIRTHLDNVLESLENKYPDKLRGLLPKIYATSNLSAENLRGLINLFSKDVFKRDHGGEDVIGRVYEYFIGEFANSEGKRGGEYFTPQSIVKTLVAMLEPTKGVVFDPCCGSGGMFVQSDLFTKHSGQLTFYGQESKDFTYRLCRMNLFIHGVDGNIKLGSSYGDDQHATLKADYILANPPFNDGSGSESGWGADKISDKDPRLTVGKEKMPLSPRNANTMWMLHFLSHLKEGGTAGFVMATNELSNSDVARLEVRKALVEQDYVDCVVQLSGQMFANTQVPCSLWFLSKARSGGGGFRKRRGEILLIDAREPGSLIPGSRKQKQFSNEDVERIASAYRDFCRKGPPAAVPGFCRVVSVDQVRAYKYVLAVGHYVGSPEGDAEILPYGERILSLVQEVQGQIAESNKLDRELRATLERILS